jgi:hypothetical protein
MPFRYVLANLLAEFPEADGVIFLDDAGEAIDFVSVEYPPFDLQVLGAHLGIHLRRLGSVTRAAALGTPVFLHIALDGAHFFVSRLPDDYCLAMVQRASTSAALARRALMRACSELRREVFA